MIKRIKFIGIPVADQDRALEFYTQKLGFRVLTDQDPNADCETQHEQRHLWNRRGELGCNATKV